MTVPLEIHEPAPFEDLSDAQLRANIDRVCGSLLGFVVAASVPDVFARCITYARELGLSGGVNSTTMTFNYDHTSSGLTAEDTPDPDDWEGLGITPLHADGEEGDRMLSINEALAGAYDLTIFQRGPKIAQDMPVELWDSLQDVNMGVLLGDRVDPAMLAARATRLAVRAGQTIIFNPSQPHMGVTRQAPRRSNATFFQTPQE